MQLPAYLESLPFPRSVGELCRLTHNQWLELLPFTIFLITLVYIVFSPFINFPNTQLRKRRRPQINCKHQLSESKVINTFDIEDLGNKTKTFFCRCWCSKKFPYCDGSHSAHNEDTGDNIGPLIITYTHKILLIGETGSGKTSFLNLLCNCSLVQALRFPGELTQFRQFNDIKLEKVGSKMESKTSGVKLYHMELGNLKLGVIDTPGFGDTHGLGEDKTNVRKIIDLLDEEEYINCVCLIMDGRQCRMSATLRYILTEMTSILPKEVLENMIVVFTNTTDPLEFNFDASSLQEYFGREIEDKRIFFIDNPYCRFEKAQKQKGKLPEEKIALSWKRAFEEAHEVLTEMCHTLKEFPQVHTSHFTTLYLKKQEIDEMVAALLATYEHQRELESEIVKAEEEANAALRTKTLNQNFCSSKTAWHCTEEFRDYDMMRKFNEAKTMEERALIFKQQLKHKQEESERRRKQHCECLLLKIEEFQELGINRSYAKCLENQLAVIEQWLRGTTGQEIHDQDLRIKEKEIETKLKLVQATLELK